MRRLKLTVAINTKLNRGHVVHGQEALILPCLARSDIDIQATGRQSVTVEDSMSMVHASGGLVHAAEPHLKSEVAIVCGMARATLPDSGIDWEAFEARLRPDPRQDRGGVSQAVRRLQRPHPPARAASTCTTARDEPSGTPPTAARISWFARASRRIRDVDEPAALRLTTIRSHDQYNTTIYSLDDRYRGVFGGRMVVFMNEDDMAERQIEAGLARRTGVAGGRDDSAVSWRASRCSPTTSRAARSRPTIRRRTICMPVSYHDPQSQDAFGEIDSGDRQADGQPRRGLKVSRSHRRTPPRRSGRFGVAAAAPKAPVPHRHNAGARRASKAVPDSM